MQNNQRVIDDLGQKFSDLLPSGLHYLKQDVEKNIKALIQANLAKMNLVSNEEFKVQQQLLARCYMRLEQLETRVAELEQQLSAKNDNPSE